MCIAIVKPAKELLSRRTLERCFRKNSHGAGFAFAKDNKLKIKKGFFSFEEFWSEFAPLQENMPMLVHFRYRTHGCKDARNCHPWEIDKNHAMIHNGVFRDFASKKSNISDTGRFVRKILKPMFLSNPSAWKQPWSKYLLEESIGSFNKFAILSSSGDFEIYREVFGMWHNGCWFSNDGFKSVISNPFRKERGTEKPFTSLTKAPIFSSPKAIKEAAIAAAANVNKGLFKPLIFTEPTFPLETAENVHPELAQQKMFPIVH